MTIDELYRLSRRTALWGLILNLALGVAKILGGYYGHSMALWSDALNSLGDAFMSCFGLIALIWSQRPPDPEHPYGHTRAEAVAGSNVALLLILSAFGVAWEALRALGRAGPEPESFTLWIAGAAALLKEGLYRYNTHVAAQTGSSIVRTTAWDHRMDAFTSLLVVLGIGLSKWAGPAWHWADHVAALGVAAVILLAGAGLFWNSLQELMDRQADPDLLDQVRRDTLAVPGVKGVEKLLVRKTGLEYLVDIHVEVDPDISVREGHAIAHAVKDRLVASIVAVKDVLVHIEPYPHDQGMA